MEDIRKGFQLMLVNHKLLSYGFLTLINSHVLCIILACD